MNKNKFLFLFVVFLGGCGSPSVSENTPTLTLSPPSISTSSPPTPTFEITDATEMPQKTEDSGSTIIDFGTGVKYTEIYFDDIESGALSQGLELTQGGAVVTTDPDEVIDGDASIRLSDFGSILTNENVLQLEGNTIYLVEFDYKILDPGTEDDTVFSIFRPIGSNDDDQELSVSMFTLLSNSELEGSFTLGGLTANEPAYYLRIGADENSSVVIDNIRILRQDTYSLTTQPNHWGDILRLPYPHLGKYMLGTSNWMAYGIGGEPPFTYSVNQIERRFAMFDVIVGVDIRTQTVDPAFSYRLRKMNPNIVILPYRLAQEQGMELPIQPLYDNATVDMNYNFQVGLADDWIVKDTDGNPVPDPGYSFIRKMNISEFSPVVYGQTFNDYLIEWILEEVMAEGHWDGIFFDNLFGHINPHILNYYDPASFDYDLNLNSLRDETPAWVSEMTRSAAIHLLQQLREEVGDLEIILGNTGPNPEIYLAPYVNGYTFECVDEAWYLEWSPSPSEANWRRVLDDYFTMEKNTVAPSINIFEGCGRIGGFVKPDHIYLNPTDEDIQVHRFTLGTTLLGDGFYVYDLFDARSAPYWFDEYTVDENGIAAEDPQNKGYLGLALDDAIELQSPATLIWQEDFESCSTSLKANDPRIYVSQENDSVISGSCSLIIDIPDHTKQSEIFAHTDPNQVILSSGETYLVEFDWRILETTDGVVESSIWSSNDELSVYRVPGVVSGDSGTAIFPLTLETGNDFTIRFLLGSGGGKVAFDNIWVTHGGVGPWRRDFENGFVLVNPLNKPYTFTADELAGVFNRTGIKRILGTQAPDVNNGHPIADSLTLQPFDAIVLLADHIRLE